MSLIPAHTKFKEVFKTAKIAIPFLDGKEKWIEVIGLDEEESTADFEASLERFLALADADREACTRYIYESYKAFEKSVLEAGDDWMLEDVSIKTPEHVWKHMRFAGLSAGREPDDGMVYVQVSYNCDWDEEHGIELTFRNGATLSRVDGIDGAMVNRLAYGLPDGDDPIVYHPA